MAIHGARRIKPGRTFLNKRMITAITGAATQKNSHQNVVRFC